MKINGKSLGVSVLILAFVIAGVFYFAMGVDNFGVDQEKAMKKVESMSEVIEYNNLLKSNGKIPQVDVEDWGDNWAVHVFEVVTEDDGTSHTATFGWYEVNKKTGEIKKN